jgi:hypothetical protein
MYEMEMRLVMMEIQPVGMDALVPVRLRLASIALELWMLLQFVSQYVGMAGNNLVNHVTTGTLLMAVWIVSSSLSGTASMGLLPFLMFVQRFVEMERSEELKLAMMGTPTTLMDAVVLACWRLTILVSLENLHYVLQCVGMEERNPKRSVMMEMLLSHCMAKDVSIV